MTLVTLDFSILSIFIHYILPNNLTIADYTIPSNPTKSILKTHFLYNHVLPNTTTRLKELNQEKYMENCLRRARYIC